MSEENVSLRRVICSDCGAVLFDGPESEMPAELLPASPADKRPCERCGGRTRQVHLTATDTVTVMEGMKLAVAGQTRHSRRHRASREALSQTRVGRDGRKVQRVMENVRDHEPPFKWHRVIDAETGEVIKNELVDHSTNRRYDFRDPKVEVPDWFPFADPRTNARELSE